MMNKRGQGLSMNTVIIAIIVLVVLVFIIIFYTGGFSNVAENIRNIFETGTAGTDRVIASQNCQSYCEQIIDEDNPTIIKNSPYCKKAFKLDFDNDGKAEKDTESGAYLNFYCSTNHVGDENNLAADERMGSGYTLGVPCPVSCTSTS